VQAKGASKTKPQRSCVACRQVREKRCLVRLVRTPEGVVVDPGGRLAGRGAYLCRSAACWQDGLKGKRLENALRASLSRENRLKLEEYAATL
jgi:predicted RNA-binding protein YlxR (DUF448 family)